MIHKMRIAKSWADIELAVENCKKTGYCSHDFETNGKHPSEPDFFPTIIGISFQPCSTIVIPLRHPESPFNKNYKEVLDYIASELIVNRDVVKIAFNAKFENKCWLSLGWDFRGVVLDPMLGKYLLDEERPNDLGSLTARIFPDFSGFKDETEKLAKKYGWANIPLKPLAERNGLDCDLALRMAIRFEKKHRQYNLTRLFRNLNMPNSQNLAHVEYRGINIDHEYLDNLAEKYKEDIEKLDNKLRNLKPVVRYERRRLKSAKKQLIKQTRKEIKELIANGRSKSDRVIKTREQKISQYIAGVFKTKKEQKIVSPINFKSQKQLADFLFFDEHGMNFDVVKYTKNKKTNKESENPSTDEESLLVLQEIDKTGFIKTLLKHRGLEHLNSTYIVGIKERLGSDNKIHGSFLIHGTVTGRLSSKNPNLQNIPRDTTAPEIKKMFIPSPGKVIMEVDYSQAELRLVAEWANETTMIEWFRTGKKIHEATACRMNNCMDRYEEIMKITKNEDHPEHIYWSKEKKKAKLVNFGILYGETAKKLSTQLKCSVEKAQEFMDKWHESFPLLSRYIKRCHRTAHKKGYMISPWGRRRRLPYAEYTEREAKDAGIYGKYLEALRQSVNAPIQGASSDFTQFSSVLIKDRVDRGIFPKSLVQLYTVHDSIGYEVEPKYIHELAPKIVELCADPETRKYFGFGMKKVSMQVNVEIGKNWGELRNYLPNEDYTKLLL